eukprot:620081-Heterocapsa_arctica.AAC.1
MTDDIKEEVIVAIGGCRYSLFWIQAGIGQKIEYIANFLATRPVQRSRLSKFGAVRVSRTEARNIIRMKKKAFYLFVTVAVTKFVYVDDTMTP